MVVKPNDDRELGKYERNEREIEEKYKPLIRRLEQLVERCSPEEKNLHIAHIKNVDETYYPALFSLARDGYGIVLEHRSYYSVEAGRLYLPDLWYNLFLLTDRVACASNAETRDRVTEGTVRELALLLMKMGEFALSRSGDKWEHGGDISKRHEEAFDNFVYFFYSKDLVEWLKEQARDLEWDYAPIWLDLRIEFIEKHIDTEKRRERENNHEKRLVNENTI